MATSEPAAVFTWQRHQDPPNMWPTLAALSALIHIGLLGLALPWMIKVMQAESETDQTVVVPIEMVVTDEATTAAVADTQDPSTVTEPTAASPSAESDQGLSNRPSDRATTASDAASPASQSRASETIAGSRSTGTATAQTASQEETRATGSSSRQNSSGSRDQSSAAGRTPTPRSSASPTPSPAPANSRGTSSPQPRPTEAAAAPAPSQSRPSPPNANSSDPPQLPTSNTAPLPPPPTTASVPRSSMFVSFVDLMPVPDSIPGDRPDNYPQLQASPSRSIVLNAGDHNCGDMGALTAQRVLVRVVISQNGHIVSAKPWPNQPGTEFEQFVACLMPQTDFMFTPARTGTQNVATDRVILEVDIGPS